MDKDKISETKMIITAQMKLQKRMITTGNLS